MESDVMHMTAKPLGVQYDFYLDFGIEGPETFYDFFQVLRDAGPEDAVVLHINSPGGSLNTCIQVIDAINKAQCTVIGSAEGEVASAAAFIFFSCHGYQIGHHCEFLVHTARGGSVGKTGDMESEVGSLQKRMRGFLKDVLGPFFTKKEIKRILDGREHYLSGDEVLDRIHKAMENMEEESE